MAAKYSQDTAPDQDRFHQWLVVRNVSGQKIPPRSLVRSIHTDHGIPHVTQNDTDNSTRLLVTGEGEIMIGGEGRATRDFPALLAFEPVGGSGSGAGSWSGTGPADPDPVTATSWGSKAGSWQLHAGYTGFFAHGEIDGLLIADVEGGAGESVLWARIVGRRRTGGSGSGSGSGSGVECQLPYTYVLQKWADGGCIVDDPADTDPAKHLPAYEQNDRSVPTDGTETVALRRPPGKNYYVFEWAGDDETAFLVPMAGGFCPKLDWLRGCGGSGSAVTSGGEPPPPQGCLCPDPSGQYGNTFNGSWQADTEATADPCHRNTVGCTPRADGHGDHFGCPPFTRVDPVRGLPYCVVGDGSCDSGGDVGVCLDLIGQECPVGWTFDTVFLYCCPPDGWPAGSPGSVGSGGGASGVSARARKPGCGSDYYPAAIVRKDPRSGNFYATGLAWMEDVNGRPLTVGERYLCRREYDPVSVKGDVRPLYGTDRGQGEPCQGCRGTVGGSGEAVPCGSGGSPDNSCGCGEYWSDRCHRCLPNNFDPSLTTCPDGSHPDACGGCITCYPGTEYLGSPCFNCFAPCPTGTFRIGCGCSHPPLDCAAGQHVDPVTGECVDDNCPPGSSWNGTTNRCEDDALGGGTP